ncbi:zinc finger protein 436 isoform X3 [Anolis carolinensis]|uniref:zinc finger protein 436 isoform X3 n=1 Tax=Anolis carolinensis TaxID=28377 RepID=UPI002F2B4FF0
MVQSEHVTEGLQWKAPEEGNNLPGKGMQQHWEAQWQEFLKTLQSPSWAWGSLSPAEETPWDEAKAFLASFEQVAKACRWPKEEWAARLMPALSGEAEQAFLSLEARDREDYGKVKAAILRGETLRAELQRQHFRQFCCQEVEDPRRVYSQVQELCSRWLKPERRSKEQILELLVLEQFLASLPQDLQGWIRGGGPETCSQAVALAEDFLLKRQQEADSARWQGLSQDVCVGSLEAERKSPGAAQGQICEEAKPVKDAEIPLLGGGIKVPSPSISVFPPEGQVKTEAGLGEGLLDCHDTGASLHTVERTLPQPGQQTIFWQVLQEEGGNVQTLGEGKATLLKVEVSQHGGDELEERPGAVPLINQGDGLLTAETCGERSEKKRNPFKIETTRQEETRPGEIWRPCAKGGKGNLVVDEIPKQQWESEGQQQIKPIQRENEDTSLSIGLTGAVSQTSTIHGAEEMSSFLQADVGCSYRSEDTMRIRADSCPFPKVLKDFPEVSCFDKHQGLKAREKENEVSDCMTKENLMGCPSNLSGRNIYDYADCDKTLNYLSAFMTNHEVPLEGRPYKCSSCGKSFTLLERLIRHQKNHTGVKPHKCAQCGKCFSQRNHLKKHERIHTGLKPHKCSQCGKCFIHRDRLKNHQRIHTGEKPYDCPECGKKFSRREHLKKHERIHTGEKPYECCQCGKCFRQREHLVGHQRTHTAEWPLKCPECGRDFSRRDLLLKHLESHKGQKSYKCGKFQSER